MAEVIGPKAAVDLAEAFGGTEDNYIPVTARIDHKFAPVIGLDRLELLCAAFPRARLEIPRGVHRDLKKAWILEMEGSHREVALRVGATQRYVREVRKLLAETRQPDLFEDAVETKTGGP